MFGIREGVQTVENSFPAVFKDFHLDQTAVDWIRMSIMSSSEKYVFDTLYFLIFIFLKFYVILLCFFVSIYYILVFDFDVHSIQIFCFFWCRCS